MLQKLHRTPKVAEEVHHQEVAPNETEATPREPEVEVVSRRKPILAKLEVHAQPELSPTRGRSPSRGAYPILHESPTCKVRNRSPSPPKGPRRDHNLECTCDTHWKFDAISTENAERFLLTNDGMTVEKISNDRFWKDSVLFGNKVFKGKAQFGWSIHVDELPKDSDSYFGWGVCEPQQVGSILNGTGYGYYVYSNGYSNLYSMNDSHHGRSENLQREIGVKLGSEIGMSLDLNTGDFVVRVDGRTVIEKRLLEKKLVPFLMVKHAGTVLSAKIT